MTHAPAARSPRGSLPGSQADRRVAGRALLHATAGEQHRDRRFQRVRIVELLAQRATKDVAGPGQALADTHAS
jgi:hypothetical protein